MLKGKEKEAAIAKLQKEADENKIIIEDLAALTEELHEKRQNLDKVQIVDGSLPSVRQ